MLQYAMQQYYAICSDLQSYAAGCCNMQQDTVKVNMLNLVNFKHLFTFYCFDVSKQEMTLGSNNVTCDLHVHFSVATPAHLRVYIGWYNDRTLEMFTDGSPINIKNRTDNYS